MLGYAEHGVPEGKALFYFHGHPGSRLESKFLAAQAAQAGVRLIGIDRPGLGLSTFKAGRCILDWPGDVIELADYLRLDRFAVVGFSGGGPYALACAYKLPQRLTACGLVSGSGHVGPVLAFLAQWLPGLILPVTSRFFSTEEQAQNSLTRFAGNWPAPDRQSLAQPGIKELMAASLVEAFRQGIRGAAYDGTLLARPWRFSLEAIQLPALYLWHGERDNQAPITEARALAAQLAKCQATYYPNEGHISLIVNHAEEIVKALA